LKFLLDIIYQCHRTGLSVRCIGSGSSSNFRLPLVTVSEKLLLVVEQLFAGLGGVFSVGGYRIMLVTTQDDKSDKHTFNNGINWATLLAVAAVDALGHINIISGRPATSVHSLLCFNGDSLGRADGLAEFAGDAALFAGWVASKSVFATETWGDWSFLEGVEDGVTSIG
jgi:hypothetical protein